jgi:hypothetical protein
MAARVVAVACGLLAAGIGAAPTSGAPTTIRSYRLSDARSALLAGYVASPGPRISTDVSASYRLRAVHCDPLGEERVVMFVGASGIHAGRRWTYQAGTSAICQDGVASYGIWYRRIGDPADHGQRVYLATDVPPGGHISVEITLNAALPANERSSIYLVWPGAGNSRVIVGPAPGKSDRQACGVGRIMRPATSGATALHTYPMPSFYPQNVTCSFRGVNEDESPQAGVANYSIPIARVDMLGRYGRPLALAQEPAHHRGGLERLIWRSAG